MRGVSVDMAERGNFASTGKSTGETMLIVDCVGEALLLRARVTTTRSAARERATEYPEDSPSAGQQT
jgi:hypothetical protein